ncbi:hypothetical protein DTO169C6_7255 [Paecilomyces variotii]|nr:hypothetical protein DTO169C6_7255 [Paecilomyces variotii]
MTNTQALPSTIKVAEYIFIRLRQLGIQSIFGVPGDYNLRLLDFVEPTGLHWVGNCNELNAAYAADGYARINGLSTLITTYGVGELSAINGIAGAFTEKSAVIHIVGTPSRRLQDTRQSVHHTLADGDYRHFAAMAAHVTKAQTNLRDPRTIPSQIDWALDQALAYSQPVYIEIPDHVVDVNVASLRLNVPISVPESPSQNVELMERILARIYEAKRPLILVDGECRPLGIVRQAEELVKMTGWPTWTTIFGKSLINEELPNVYGNYAGSLGCKEWKTYFESADLIINLGPHYTQSFTTIPLQAVSVTFSRDTVQVGNDVYQDIPGGFMTEILKNLDQTRIPTVEGPSKSIIEIKAIQDGLLVQETFWHFVNLTFRPGDLVLTETGTAAHGGRLFKLPRNTRLFAAVTWLSIGYMLPATLGAALARRELSGEPESSRAILFIGDGSLQMSVQEISTIIKEKLNVIIFIINNNGYTIERAIHGRKQAYNDIATWRNDLALAFFGADEKQVQSHFSARSYSELEEVLNNDSIQNGRGLRTIEVFMGREDVQGSLLNLMQSQISKEQTL